MKDAELRGAFYLLITSSLQKDITQMEKINRARYGEKVQSFHDLSEQDTGKYHEKRLNQIH